MRVSRFGAVAVAVLTLGGVGCSSPSSPSSPGTSNVAPPATTAPSLATTTNAPAATVDLRAYFMHGETIAVAYRSVAATPQVATAAMSELLAGPTAADASAGLTTAIPSGTRLRGIDIASGTATVDLTGAFESGGGSLSMSARLAQVTFTLTQFPTVQRVQFRVDGNPVTAFGGEGIVLDHPATRATFEALAPPILVESPGPGRTVRSPLRITGSANVFEAQFQAELTDGAGKVLASQAVHATSGTGTRGTFDAMIVFQAGAAGPATLTVFDTSAKDGARIDVVTVPLELAA